MNSPEVNRDAALIKRVLLIVEDRLVVNGVDAEVVASAISEALDELAGLRSE